ncbi:MAG: DUF4007 family protein, partial [Gammaproteobacteria bacterium]|nr:DUF4007 family protein [Gammaproteobacteria bacterium]
MDRLPGAGDRYRFTGHESFPLRYSWLPKGIQTLEVKPGVFRDDQATIVLGVGKNMVAAIRHWCIATGMARVTGTGGIQATALGRQLFLTDGW